MNQVRSQSTYDNLKNEMIRLSKRLEAAAGQSSSEKSEEFIPPGAEQLRERMNNLLSATRQAGKKAYDYAGDNPWQIAGIVAAVGALTAFLLTRGRD